MNHLKLYKIFESDSAEDIRNNLEDIFIELQDAGYNVSITWSYKESKDSKRAGSFTIGITRTKSTTNLFKLKDVYQTFLTAKGYMDDNDYYLNYIDAKSVRDYHGLAYSIDLYEKGKGELFDQDISSLLIEFELRSDAWINKVVNRYNESIDIIYSDVIQNWISEVMSNCKYILLELEDQGMQTDVKRSLHPRHYPMREKNTVLIECMMSYESPVRWARFGVKDVYDRLADYMKSEGFEERERRIGSVGDFPVVNGKYQGMISFIKSGLDSDYIGNLRYLKKYNKE